VLWKAILAECASESNIKAVVVYDQGFRGTLYVVMFILGNACLAFTRSLCIMRSTGCHQRRGCYCYHHHSWTVPFDLCLGMELKQKL